jgi:uncharacterized membrane protein
MTSAVAYIVTLVLFAALDIAWLTAMGSTLYRPVLGDMLAPTVRVMPAIAFYVVYPIGLVVFAVMPALKSGSLSDALVLGALFGILTYATYDLTNYATLKNWTLELTVIDVIYGAVVASSVSAIAYLAVPAMAEWAKAMIR